MESEGLKMLNVVSPDSREKIEKQIKALKMVLSKDTREKDKQIHIQAIADLERELGIL